MPRAGWIPLSILVLLLEPTPGAQDARPVGRAAAGNGHPPVTGGDGEACATCHSEVTSQRELHGPVAAGTCSACHQLVERDGRTTTALAHGARHGDTARLCVACHEEFGERMKNEHLHAPVAAGDCTSCHDPHGSRFRFQLPEEGNRACLACHVDLAEALNQPFRHGPAVASCTICHDPHAAKFPSQLRGSVNRVCLACHLEARVSGTIDDPATLFGAREAQGLAAGPTIRLDPSLRSGHPNRGHPVEGPKDPSARGRPLTCMSCHNPHGTSGRKLLRFGAMGTSSLCIRCHQF